MMSSTAADSVAVTRHQDARGPSARGAVRTTRHAGYALSQTIRMRIEAIFGWAKSIGGLRRMRVRGRLRTQLAAHIIGAAYNLLRIAKLRRAAT